VTLRGSIARNRSRNREAFGKFTVRECLALSAVAGGGNSRIALRNQFAFSQAIPAIALNHALNNQAPSGRADRASFVPQFRFAHGVDQIAFHQRFPIQPVCAIQEYFRAIRWSPGPLRRA